MADEPSLSWDAGRVSPWLDGLEPVLETLAADIRSDLGREPDSGDLLIVLRASAYTIAAGAMMEDEANPGTLEERITSVRASRVAWLRELHEQLEAFSKAQEEAVAAGDSDRAERLHIEQRQLSEHHTGVTRSQQRMAIDFSRLALGVTDGLGNRVRTE